MSFKEKSAYVMSVALLAAAAIYAILAARSGAAGGGAAAPFLPALTGSVIVLILIAIGGHVLAAVGAPREAGAATDERNRAIAVRAGRLSREVLAWGVVVSLGLFLATRDAGLLFHGVLASLVLAQLADYAAQITLFRTAV